jgi:hypothetical protein
MSNPEDGVDMSYCDSCFFRDQEVAPGMVCARRALDNVRFVFGSIAEINSEVPGHQAIDAYNRDTENEFAGMFTEDVRVCIESVSNGGKPVISED